MIRIIIYFTFITLFLTSCMENIIQSTNTSWSWVVATKYATGLTDDQKVALTIARKKELRTIRKWDYMTLKNNPEQAISYYLDALEKLPNDTVIKRKIAHTYYILRDWKNAYKYYSWLPLIDLKDTDKNELFQSLLFDDTRSDTLAEMGRYELDSVTSDYYNAINICYTGIHNCIVNIESYSGTSTQIIAIQKIISKSTQISPDFQYRNFLVAAEFYQNSMYRVVDVMTNEILIKRPNYNEVKKLRGFALYELGKYTQSRDVLLNYIAENPKDLESIVKLGDIYVSLWDFITSSLYYNNAVTAWYPHKTEIERRLAYNYSALHDNAAMLKVLWYLIQETDVTEDDFAVAISLALYQWENIKAYAWAYAGMQKYKNSVLLMPLYLSVLRFNGRFTTTIEFVKSLPDELALNPLVQLEFAIALYETGDISQSLFIFKTISEQDPIADWSEEAKQYIQIIEAMQESSGSIKAK